MKLKKLTSVLLAALFLTTLLSASALAGAAWYECTVDQAGPLGGTTTSPVRIFLTDVTTDTPAWAGSKEFNVNSDRAKEYLAVALTAMTTGKKVRAYLNPALALPTLYGLYLMK